MCSGDDGATLNETVQASKSKREQEEKAQTTFTPDMFKEGAKQLCKALWGKYRDLDGKMQSVKGDMTKLRYVASLSGAARRLLANIEHTSRRLPGTQEVRRLMRFDTNAMRVRYGVPIFVTFSPDEAHNLLMVRLSRTRRNDPVFAEGSDPVGRRYCGRCDPSLGQLPDTTVQNSTTLSDRERGGADQEGDVIMDVPIDDIINSLPTYDQRRLLLARDSLASVDGFKMLVMVTYEYLFGMRVCIFCPDCNAVSNGRPCQDLFGSNAHAEGGIFGRIDAGFTSIEAQKSTGSLHAHTLLWVQCLHQHTPLVDTFLKAKDSAKDLVAKYLRYKEHV